MNNQQYTPENDPQHNLRSDLWPYMDVPQLIRQQEIVTDKLLMVYNLIGNKATPSLQTIYGALQTALNDLSNLINNPPRK